MKKILIEGFDRQHVAAILLARLGPSMCWFHQLMQFASRGSRLHGSGPTLLPFATVRARPVYSREAVRAFIEQALVFDPSLGPHRPKAALYEVAEAALSPTPYRIFRAVPVPVPSH